MDETSFVQKVFFLKTAPLPGHVNLLDGVGPSRAYIICNDLLENLPPTGLDWGKCIILLDSAEDGQDGEIRCRLFEKASL